MAIVPPVRAGETPAPQRERIEYPKTRRVDHVDTYFGVRVPDPYRWLEADVRHDKAVADWVAAENKVTARYLEAIPERETIRRRLTELWNFPQYGGAFKAGGRYYLMKNDGLQNQSVLYVMDTLAAKPRPIIDPNTWSADGTIALGGLAFTKDGRYLAYSRAEAGSDWMIWHVMEIATGKILPDEVRWSKSGQASWTKDGKGFFYSRYDEPKKGAEFQSLNFNSKIFYHRLGDPQSKDTLFYYQPEHPEWEYDAAVTEDGQWLVIVTHLGSDERNRVTIIDLTAPGGGSATIFSAERPIELIDNFEHEYTFVGNVESEFYFKTDLDAPRRRLVAIDIGMLEGPRIWKEIIPQAVPTLIQASFVGDRFIASYLEDVKPRVRVFKRDGKHVRDVQFPAIGTVAGFGGERTDKETFYTFSSFATPPSIYRYDIATGESTLFRRPELKFNPDDYKVKQIFYHSKDGTRVPMFIVYKKGIKLDGSNPTLLYGYGGFDVSVLPAFSVARLTWMEMGGVFAQPNLRGGGEYGEAWHKAGTKLHKQNVFDDFIAAAQWLIANKITPNGQVGDLRGQQRRAVGRGGDDRAAGPVRGLSARGGRDGHAAVPEVHRGTNVGRRLRLVRQRGGVQGDPEIFTVSKRQARRLLSGDAGDHGRHGRSRGARAQFQVCRGPAIRSGLRQARADPHRNPRRPRRGQADEQADRRSDRPLGVSREEPRNQTAIGVTATRPGPLRRSERISLRG